MGCVIISEYPDEDVRKSWDSALDSADFASFYTSPEFFAEPYLRERRPFALLAYGQEGQIDGVLTGIRRGSFVVCGESGSPQIAVRIGVDARRVGYELAEGLMRYVGVTAKLVTVYAWSCNSGFQMRGFRSRECAAPVGTVILDLRRGADRLFKEVSQTHRNQIRRAIREGVEVTVCDLARDFDDYYRLYLEWSAFKRLRPQEYEIQRNAFMASNRLVLVARHENRLIGVSTFRYRRPGVIEYTANVSRRQDSKVRQNDLLLWRAIEWATAQPGLHTFSMGSAHFFLQGFGGDPCTTYRYQRDCTMFRRYDAKEGLSRLAVYGYRMFPRSTQTFIKRALGRVR